MDLTTGIVALQAAETTSRIQYAVARKILDQQQCQGSTAVKLIEAAAKSGARAGDRLVADALGLGHQLDTYG